MERAREIERKRKIEKVKERVRENDEKKREDFVKKIFPLPQRVFLVCDIIMSLALLLSDPLER